MVLTGATFLAALGLALIGLPLYRNNQEKEGREQHLYAGAAALTISAVIILALLVNLG
ncbi:MAG: hypothetical protein ACI977_000696 [Candidatus Nanohaloarchaea archaeon]|jgi:hypothetical protein